MSSTSISRSMLESQLPSQLEPIDKIEFHKQALTFLRSLGSNEQLKELEVELSWQLPGTDTFATPRRLTLAEVAADTRIEGIFSWLVELRLSQGYMCFIQLTGEAFGYTPTLTIDPEVWKAIVGKLSEADRNFVVRIALEPHIEKLRTLASRWEETLGVLDRSMAGWRSWLENPDPDLEEEDDTPGPFVISPFTAGKRPRPGQPEAYGL